MDAYILRLLFIPLMAEAFINLTQYTNRDVSEVQIVPVHIKQWRLKGSLAEMPPPSQDGLQMPEQLAAGFFLRRLVILAIGSKSPPTARIARQFRLQRQQIA